MSIYEIIIQRRTIRKYKQWKIDRDIFKKLINAARHAPSAANLQPLKYIIIDDPETVNEIFENVKWAVYIYPEGTPKEDEKPVAFIAVLIDKEIKSTGYELLDVGLAVQNIFLTACEEGIGTCLLAAINREKIISTLSIPENYALNSLIALGFADEKPIVEECEDSIKYYKDQDGTLHVPKRKLEDIIL